MAAIAVGIIALTGIGCTEQAERELDKIERSTTNNKALNRKIANISLGSSIDSVKAELGRPDNYQVSTTAGLGKSEYLYYGQWQLAFTNGELESKNKY